VVIPSLVEILGLPHHVLPPGVHWATLAEVEAAFATSGHRQWLFEGFIAVVAVLRNAGCRTIYLGGSFVTSKDKPGDYDGCWDPTNVQARLLDQVLLDFENERAAQKWKYRGEMFISTMEAGALGTYLDFLQCEKETGRPVGVIGLRLRTDSWFSI
jgi:hypothetical protein